MLINFTNHPSSRWDQNQINAAANFGNIIDLQFPAIDSNGDESYIQELVTKYVSEIENLAEAPSETTVHVMGEMTFTFAIIHKLKELGFQCVASTTERMVTELSDGTKMVSFKFVRFRRYY